MRVEAPVAQWVKRYPSGPGSRTARGEIFSTVKRGPIAHSISFFSLDARHFKIGKDHFTFSLQTMTKFSVLNIFHIINYCRDTNTLFKENN